MSAGQQQQEKKNYQASEKQSAFSVQDETAPPLHSNSTSRRAQERELTRKLDRRILPLTCSLFLLGQLDRSNIGNAKLGGIVEDLHLTQSEYQWSLSILYIAFILFDVPCNIIMRRWRASRWIGLVGCLWGITTMCMAATRNFSGLVACRFFLGVCEAGLIPAFQYYFSVWYTRQEYCRRWAFLFSFLCLANACGGLIAYGISMIPTSRLNTWQWIFIIEGIPSIVLGLLVWVYLPDTPETAAFLTKQERELEIERLAYDQQGAAHSQFSWSWSLVGSIFKDWKTYVYSLITIVGLTAVQGMSLFLPSIINGLGSWTRAQSQALTTPPNILAFMLTNLAAWTSDKFFERGFHTVLGSLVGMTGFLILMFVPTDEVGARYFAACLITISANVNGAVTVAWMNNNWAGLTRRAVGAAFATAIGNFGGIIGSQIYYDPPLYFAGFTIAFSCVALEGVTALILRVILARENNRRARLTPEQRETEIQKYGGDELAGDRHPDFRYVL